MATRIRLSRAKGWRKPEGAVVVSRPSRWGNPFTLDWVRLGYPNETDHNARIVAVQTFHWWLTDDKCADMFTLIKPRRAWILEHLPELAGRDLACWCPLPKANEVDWCHAAVLLLLANGSEQ